MNFSKNNQSNISDEFVLFHRTHVGLMESYTAVALCICIMGTFANILCFLAICLYPKLRHTGNILVGNFILVNLTLTAIAYPCSILSVYLHAYPSVQYPPLFCQWILFYYFAIHALCWQECFLALNRFVAIVLPFHYQLISSKRSLITTVCAGYLVPLVLNVCAGTIGEKSLFTMERPFGSCLPNPVGDRNFQVIHSVIGVYLPMSLVGTVYLIIFVRVFFNRLVSGTRMVGSYRRRVAMTRMLCAGFLWFCMTYLPQPVMTTFFKSAYDEHPWSYVGSRWALFLGAGMSAVIYAATNRDYRRGMAYVLRLRCGKIENRKGPSKTELELEAATVI